MFPWKFPSMFLRSKIRARRHHARYLQGASTASTTSFASSASTFLRGKLLMHCFRPFLGTPSLDTNTEEMHPGVDADVSQRFACAVGALPVDVETSWSSV